MGSYIGVMKIAAKRVGVTIDEYERRTNQGEKWCTACREWKLRDSFDVDRSRGDGLTAGCKSCRRVKVKKTFKLSPPSTSVRDKASTAVHREIRNGRLLKASACTCKCGNAASQYHHYKGYAPENWLDVEPMCASCHRLAHWE